MYPVFINYICQNNTQVEPPNTTSFLPYSKGRSHITYPFPRAQRTSVCKTSRGDVSYVNSDRQKAVRAQESKAALLVRQQSIELIERGEESPEAEAERNSSPEGDRPGYLNEFPLSPLEEKRLSHVGEIGDNRELVSD